MTLVGKGIEIFMVVLVVVMVKVVVEGGDEGW